jgi:hypothetical protein
VCEIQGKMRSRQASVNSANRFEDDQQPLTYTTSPHLQHDYIMLHANEDRVAETNINDDKADRETEPLLDIYQVEPSASGFSLCSNIPARYTIAIWAFFGFFSLYAMRVNLSVAIVAMVRQSIVCLRTS